MRGSTRGTSRITGRETIVLHNNTADSLTSIVMRLDMNMFLFNVPRAAPWVPAEETDGFAITRMTVNGQPVNLTAPAFGRGGGRGRGGAPPAPTENVAVRPQDDARHDLARQSDSRPKGKRRSRSSGATRSPAVRGRTTA